MKGLLIQIKLILLLAVLYFHFLVRVGTVDIPSVLRVGMVIFGKKNNLAHDWWKKNILACMLKKKYSGSCLKILTCMVTIFFF